MPNGFRGRPASAYLGQVSSASNTASSAASQGVERANESLQSSVNANARANEAAIASITRETARLQAGSPQMMIGSQVRSTASRVSSVRPAPILREPRPVRLLHPPESAYIGNFSLWRGNSTNIVVNQSEYDSIYHIVDNIDNNMGACVHNVATEIEEMCRTSFILPSAGPRCLNISDSIKRSLGQFRMVTEDSLIQMRRYVNEMMGIG